MERVCAQLRRGGRDAAALTLPLTLSLSLRLPLPLPLRRRPNATLSLRLPLTLTLTPTLSRGDAAAAARAARGCDPAGEGGQPRLHLWRVRSVVAARGGALQTPSPDPDLNLVLTLTLTLTRYDGGRNLQDLLVFKLDYQGGPAIRDVPCGPAPEARCRHSAHIIGSQLFVLGGYNGTLPWAPDVYCSDSDDAPSLFSKFAAGVPKSR